LHCWLYCSFSSSYNSDTSSGNRNRVSSNCRISGKKKLFRKEGKHEKIAVLAQDKLSAVSDCISKALDDEDISEEEYSLIVSELDKFREMKEQIRAKIRGVSQDVKSVTDKKSLSRSLSRVMTTK